MDKRAWIGQLKKQVAKVGEDKAAWYVYWNDPDTGRQKCKSCGPGKIGKSAANRLADTTHSQLVTGTYQSCDRERWGHHLDKSTRQKPLNTFMARFNEHIEGIANGVSLEAAQLSIKTFERIAKPSLMKSVNADMIDKYITKRLAEITKRKGPDGQRTKVSPATVNRELRYLKAALHLAVDWNFMDKVPRIRFQKLQQKLPTFVPPEHFAAIYQACSSATLPASLPNVTAAEWWRGLIVLLYMTGWRIGQAISLRWDEVDLEACTALSRSDVSGNKGKRDDRVPLHDLIVSHLRPLEASFQSHVFPWQNHLRVLWEEFVRIQEAVRLPGDMPMPKGGKNGAWYGFHDLRRGFATCNAEALDLFELQALMQHQSLETTKTYVNMVKRLKRAADGLFVPSLTTATG